MRIACARSWKISHGYNQHSISTKTDYCVVMNVYTHMQLLSHLSVPDEIYQSVKVKVKVDYLGMRQDGQ